MTVDAVRGMRLGDLDPVTEVSLDIGFTSSTLGIPSYAEAGYSVESRSQVQALCGQQGAVNYGTLLKPFGETFLLQKYTQI